MTNAGNIYLGTAEAFKMYLGSTLILDNSLPNVLPANPAILTMTGQSVTFIPQGKIEADAATLTITGQSASFIPKRILEANNATLTMTGQSATLTTTLGDPIVVTGTAFTGTAFSNNSSVVMPDTDVAVLLNGTAEEIQGHTWNGSVFTAAGTNASLTVANDSGAARLGTDGFVASGNGSTWQEYNWTGSGFSTVGSSFNLGSDAKVASSSSTRIFANKKTGNQIAVWDKTTGWSESATLSVTFNFFNHAICVLDKTVDAELIAVYNRQTQDIRLYTYNGTSLSYVTGSAFSWKDGSVTLPDMARLNATTFAYVDSSGDITIFTTDGSTITQGDTVNISSDLGLTMSSPYINDTPTDNILILAGRNSGTIAHLTYNP